MNNTIYDTIVIGAGQAGLAAGYHLQQAGLRFVILEASDEPVGSWPHYHDNLALNSPARYSSLPGLPFPGDPNRYPVRDEVTAYLRHYATHFKLPVITKAKVLNIEQTGKLFRVLVAGRGCYLARTIVAATGFFHHPNIPILPGRDQYRGRVLHTAAYHTPEPFHGQRVVIVGGANGAVHIGMELAQVANVTLSTQRPIRYLPQNLLGQDIHFWLRLTGLDNRQWLGEKSMLVYDSGEVKAKIAAGRPDQKALFQSFTPDGVMWSDGHREKVDAVIFGTGYRPHLPYLAGLGALDETERVLHQRGVSTTVPGLYYVGLIRQRSVASTTLRGAGVDAQVVVKHLRRYALAQQASGGRSITHKAHAWAIRSSEWAGLITMMRLALKEQHNTSPRLVGEALVRSAVVSAGFLGLGSATRLYSTFESGNW
ncbi:MAG: NAD(P)/FAD-dependent oxidoreductase [Anaerolineae bacterium]|nr:NAD(P)/FAD-dependent oxidoreductase [Anaerolineae bacterium]